MKKIFIADMHTHSNHSHDSVCLIEDMAESQKEKGTEIFAVTDHCDVEYFETQDLEKIIGNSVADAQKSNSKIKGIEILRGVEIGEGFWNKDVTEKIVLAYPYDVIIGSVHAVKFPLYEMPYSTIDFRLMGKEKSEKYFEKYLDDMVNMIENTKFDILAHLTCPLRYMNGKYGLNISCKNYESKITNILKMIVKRGISLEINTSCKGSSYDEFMPEEWIVSLYKKLGGYLVTLASDAHIKENASHRFEDALKMLKRNGFDGAFYYKDRHPIKYEI